MGHSPRKDNALFWALALGIVGTFAATGCFQVYESVAPFRVAPAVIIFASYGVGAVTGGVVYYLVWKRGEAKERARMGLCIKCGYNLTGNVSGRCPECGKEV